jgi:uncharacterized protein DUF2877
VTIGPDVPPGEFPVEVHSVFRSALNLRRPGSANLLTVLSSEACDCPQGIRLASVEDFTSLSLEAGAFGAFREGGISVERAGGALPLRVDCSTARRITAEGLPAIGDADEVWGAGLELLSALQGRAGADLRIECLLSGASAPGILGERLARAALDLGCSVRTGAVDSARGALSRIVGLGTGLTPAGDDFLCGFVAAAHCRSGARPERARLLETIERGVEELLATTTALSGTFLRGALAGRVFRPLQDLADACAGTPGTDVKAAILHLARIGHSSGMDVATGFFYGLTVW